MSHLLVQWNILGRNQYGSQGNSTSSFHISPKVSGFSLKAAAYSGIAQSVVQVAVNHKVGGSSPSTRANGDLAQLGEHLLCKQRVKGSIPLISTNMRS